MNLVHENYLTAREVAETFRVTVTTIYSWIKEGDIAAVHVGGTWRIPRSQFARDGVAARLGEVREARSHE